MLGPLEPCVVRSVVPAKPNPLDYREELRHDFWYTCAYCCVSETEAQGIGFEVEHYEPKSLKPELESEYSNLMWSCQVCNSRKGDYPFKEGPVKPEYYILRPDKEHPGDHYVLHETELKPASETGEFNITWMDLNRSPLKRLREIRNRLHKSLEVAAFGLRTLQNIHIDRLLPTVRGLFLQQRKALSQDVEELRKELHEFIRNRSRSVFRDPEPNKKERLKARREFLKQEGVISPEESPEKNQVPPADKP
jgi:hypothetical protein